MTVRDSLQIEIDESDIGDDGYLKLCRSVERSHFRKHEPSKTADINIPDMSEKEGGMLTLLWVLGVLLLAAGFAAYLVLRIRKK